MRAGTRNSPELAARPAGTGYTEQLTSALYLGKPAEVDSHPEVMERAGELISLRGAALRLGGR